MIVWFLFLDWCQYPATLTKERLGRYCDMHPAPQEWWDEDFSDFEDD